MIDVVFGPTGSGKSDLAMRIAKKRRAELVVCDAVMVYRGFDIGSNKPTPQEQADVRHHGLDLVDASEEFSAADYARAIEPLCGGGRPLVLVVGTFLYFRALAYGLGPLPKGDAQLRQQFLEREQADPGYLAREVQRIDPESFAEANGKNVPRLVRALEVFELSGKTASAWRREHGGFVAPKWPLRRYLLAPDREQAAALIARRTQAMLARGWIAEVERLRAAGVSVSTRAMNAIGYREINQMLDGTLSRAELVERIVIATRQYARRQRNFFAHEPEVKKLPMFGGDVPDSAIETDGD